MHCKLPFFEQFQIGNKEQLIKELEGGNNKKEQNSIYDIVKEQKNEKQVDLKVQNQEQNKNQNDENPGVIIINRKKKKGCC